MEIIHYHFKTLTSTNDWSKENFSSFTPNTLTIVLAEEQSKGRGQYGRTWIAPAGLNIYVSFCFYISEREKQPLTLTHVMALSVIQVLQKCGVEGRIKPPNDVRVNKKKICGILCETVEVENRLGIVIGVGLNVNMPAEILDAIEQPATSIGLETNKLWSINEILSELTKAFTHNLHVFLMEGFSPFETRFQKLIETSTRRDSEPP